MIVLAKFKELITFLFKYLANYFLLVEVLVTNLFVLFEVVEPGLYEKGVRLKEFAFD